MTFNQVYEKYIRKGTCTSSGRPIHGKECKWIFYKFHREFKVLGLDVHRCNDCGRLDSRWNSRTGKVPKMELHHINGNWNDNRLCNLEMLCPTCHSLTPNYKGRKS